MVSSVRNASRIDPRLTPNRSASARSAGRAWPAGKVPSRIRTRIRSAISSATRVFLIGSIRPEIAGAGRTPKDRRHGQPGADQASCSCSLAAQVHRQSMFALGD